MGSVLDQMFERAERELKESAEDVAHRMRVARASAEMAAGIDLLAKTISSDPSAGGINAREMALRLWLRGVRVMVRR